MSELAHSFIYVCTQKGAENLCKAELARAWPQLRFAFSRPGFLTFKVPEELNLDVRYDLKSIFARTTGFSGQRLKLNESGNDKAFQTQLKGLLDQFSGSHLHTWSRDMMIPGTAVAPVLQEGLGPVYQPGTNACLDNLLKNVEKVASGSPGKKYELNRIAAPDEMVFDLIMVEPTEIWTGWHQASSLPSRWPGGIPKIRQPEKMISRAYLKVTEALLWSRLPLKKEDVCVEIGSAPGGTAQALLARGAKVIGVDPAEMDETIAKHSDFTWMRCRGHEIRCRELKRAKWLLMDSNIKPEEALETVERIVTNQSVSIRGMLLTMKLADTESVEEINRYLQSVKDWGFGYVRARQLAFQRNEFCIAAFRNKAMLRVGS